MPFSSTTLIKAFLIIFAASHIAIAGPVPDSILSARAEQAPGGSVSSSNQPAGRNPLLELLSDSSEHGGSGESMSCDKGVGGSPVADTHRKHGDTVGSPADPYSAIGNSAQGGSVSGGGGGGFLDILSGNAGNAETSEGLSILDILRKRNL